AFPREDRAGAFITLASGLENDPAEALPIRADARLAAATLMQGQIADYHLAPGRNVSMVPATGALEDNGLLAQPGVSLAISHESLLQVRAHCDAEVILVDVA